MHSLKKSILFGFLVWLFPFVVAFLIYPIHESNRPLFESIMPLVITISVVAFSYLYFKNVDKNVKAEGAKLGIIFLLINLIIDLIMFMPSACQNSLRSATYGCFTPGRASSPGLKAWGIRPSIIKQNF